MLKTKRRTRIACDFDVKQFLQLVSEKRIKGILNEEGYSRVGVPREIRTVVEYDIGRGEKADHADWQIEDEKANVDGNND